MSSAQTEQKQYKVRVRTNISKEPVPKERNNSLTKMPIRRPSATTTPATPQDSSNSDNSPSTPTTTTTTTTPTTTNGNSRKSLPGLSSSTIIGSATEKIIANAIQQQKRSTLGTGLSSAAKTETNSPTSSSPSQTPVDEEVNNSVQSNNPPSPIVTPNNTTTPITTNNNNNNSAILQSKVLEPKRRNSQRLVGIPNKKVITSSQLNHHSSSSSQQQKQMTQEEMELSLSNFTLPMLPTDQIQQWYGGGGENEESSSFTFHIQNPMYSTEEAQEVQIMMTREDIETYNAVIKRIEGVNKDKHNHFVFEYEMASYMARNHLNRRNVLTSRLANGTMPLRKREKKPLDEFFHDEHDISKCSKNWRFQMRIFNENNGFVDAVYETPASLIRPTWEWKHEFMSQQQLLMIDSME